MKRRRVLIVTGRPPWPPWRGDQLRTRQWVEALRGRCDLTVLSPPSERRPDYADWPGVVHETYFNSTPARRGLRAAGAILKGLPGQCGLYHFPALSQRLREIAPHHDLAVVLLARLALHAPDLGDTPWIADLVDSLSLSFTRRARYDRLVLRPLWLLEAGLLWRAERRMIQLCRRALVVSQRDHDHLRHRLPNLRERLTVVPVAIEQASKDTGSPSATPTIAFTGNLGYFVNGDGLTWWLTQVWPRLREVRPDVHLLVAGDRPPPRLEQAVNAAGGQLVSRPTDLRGLLASATLAIAPLRAGAGMPLKVLDAWSVGVPVVASPWAAAGVAARHDHDLMVAESPAEWISELTALLDSAPTRRRIVEGGRQTLQERYSTPVVFGQLQQVVDTVIPTQS